jgi:hypothetical protein
MFNILNLEHVKYKNISGVKTILNLPVSLSQNDSIEIYWDSTFYISSITLTTNKNETLKVENYVGQNQWQEITDNIFTYETGNLLKISTDIVSQGIKISKTEIGTIDISGINVFANPDMAQFETSTNDIVSEIMFNDETGDTIQMKIKNNTDKTLYDIEGYFPEDDPAAWAFVIQGDKKLIKPSQTRHERAVLELEPLLQRLTYNKNVSLTYQPTISNPYIYGPVNIASQTVGVILNKKPSSMEIISDEGVFPINPGINNLVDVVSNFYIATDTFVDSLFVAIPAIRNTKTHGVWNGDYLVSAENKPAMMIYKKEEGKTYTQRII